MMVYSSRVGHVFLPCSCWGFFSQHWPDGIMIPDADVDVCIPCSISHDSFIYTSLYIIIPIYINLYINLYHSISYIYGLHGLYCCCSTCSS